MRVYASFKSVNTIYGLKKFRYDTELRSENNNANVQLKPIGLIVMSNPGSAKPVPIGNVLDNLDNGEYETPEPVLTEKDPTLSKCEQLVTLLYINHNRVLPDHFIVRIENLFNLVEKKVEDAKKLFNNLKTDLNDYDNLMFRARPLESEYEFVILAWGNSYINTKQQTYLRGKYKDAIIVNRKYNNGQLEDVTYPVHPLQIDINLFAQTSQGRLKVL